MRNPGTHCVECKELEIRRLRALFRLRECDAWAAMVRFKVSAPLKVGLVNAIADTNVVTVGLRAN